MSQTIRPEQTTSDGDTAARLGEELAALMIGERAAFISHCHSRAMSMGHVYLMSKIHRNGPIPMTRVAELIGSGLPTATGFVNRLEERGLVRREHDTRDRRVVLVGLTEAGMADMVALNEARQQRMAAAIHQLTPRQQDALLAGVQALRSALERANQGADLP